jgi:hypothetical protein
MNYKLETIDRDSIPARPTPKYRVIVTDFWNSGQEAARVRVTDGTSKDPNALASGLRLAAGKEEVRVRFT